MLSGSSSGSLTQTRQSVVFVLQNIFIFKTSDHGIVRSSGRTLIFSPKSAIGYSIGLLKSPPLEGNI